MLGLGERAGPDDCRRRNRNHRISTAPCHLDQVGLGGRLDHRPAELSGGQRQRTAIARALVRLPVLVLADEPTGNLDQSTAAQVADLLLELQEAERNMLITVTHSAALARRMQRRMELDGGRLREVA